MPLPLDLTRQIQSQPPSDAWPMVIGAAWEICERPITADRPAGEVMRRAREVAALDLYLATAGYDLWPNMEATAPRNSTALARWWSQSQIDRAVPILDTLTLREVPWILQGAPTLGYTVQTARPHVSEMPPETTPFAKAHGFAQRSALEANGAASGHCFPGAKTECVGILWAESAGYVTSDPDFVLWHHWPDTLIHAADGASLERLAKDSSKDFWYLVQRLTTGRRLVITSDHGYTATGHFQNTEDDDQAKYLQQSFKSGRLADGAATGPWSPPLDVRIQSAHRDRRMVLVLRPEGSYAFLHDRIQEAAYALIPESAREAHLSIPMTDAHVDGNLVTAPLGLRIRFGSRSLCKCLSAALLKKLRAYDRPQERGFIGRQMAAPGFDPETDVGASKDKGQPICWPHPVSPLAPMSTATPPLRGSASVVLHCAPQ